MITSDYSEMDYLFAGAFASVFTEGAPPAQHMPIHSTNIGVGYIEVSDEAAREAFLALSAHPSM